MMGWVDEKMRSGVVVTHWFDMRAAPLPLCVGMECAGGSGQ